MKTVYLDSTIPSYLFDKRESIKTYIELTERWWKEERDNYRIVVSGETVAETSRGDHPYRTEIMQFVSQLEILPYDEQLEQIAELSTLNDRLTNRTLYAPPSDGLLTSAQLDRFARVQGSMLDDLDSGYQLLHERAEKLHGIRSEKSSSQALTIREAILLFKDLGPILSDAKTAQIDALNSEGFSMSEYRWVRERLYRSLGFTRVNNYLEDFDEAMKGETTAELKPLPAAEEPGANLDLAALYSDSADTWFPFLVFGL